MNNLILFASGTLVLAFLSRRSLLNFRQHGFYRFLAWETQLAMFLLNVPAWFEDPFAWHQWISWLLLMISLVWLALGLRLLRRIGGQDAAGRDASLIGWEKTSKLVTVGVYHYIRHPMYSSLLFLGWGIFFKLPSWPGAGLAVLCTILLAATVRVEERENINYFGNEYMEYMKRTKMFIPFVF